jgi:hypothetical protein
MYTLKIYKNTDKKPTIKKIEGEDALEVARYAYIDWEVEVYKDGRAYAVKAPNSARLRMI